MEHFSCCNNVFELSGGASAKQPEGKHAKGGGEQVCHPFHNILTQYSYGRLVLCGGQGAVEPLVERLIGDIEEKKDVIRRCGTISPVPPAGFV